MQTLKKGKHLGFKTIVLLSKVLYHTLSYITIMCVSCIILSVSYNLSFQSVLLIETIISFSLEYDIYIL